MASTFQKRQKEMKRQEKQRMKAERRAQRKLEKSSAPEGDGSNQDFMELGENTEWAYTGTGVSAPAESE
jgi:hypothetical protein